MALVHKRGSECVLSSLELFSVPPTQASIERGQFTRYYPLMNMGGQGPVEFKFSTSENEFCDLSNIYLYTKNRILDGQGNPIPPKTQDGEFNQSGIVFPINNFASSRFKSLEMYLNNQQISEQDTMYAYRAYLQTLVSLNRGAKKTMASMMLWSKDHHPDNNFVELEGNELSEDANEGAWVRFQTTKFSKPFETMSKVHADLLSQDRFLPSNCEVRLRFHRADTAFALMAKDNTKNFTIVLDSAVLFVRYVEVASHVHESIIKASLAQNYLFPVRKVKCLFQSFSTGRSCLSSWNLISGRLPRRLLVGFVKSSSFHGDLSTSPFNFQDFNLSMIVVRANSQSFPCDSGIEADYKQRNFLQAYWSLLQGTTNLFTNTDIDLSPDDFVDGHCLYGFDLSPEMSSGTTDHLDLLHDGNLDIEVKLSTATICPVTMVVLLEFDHVIEMTTAGDIVSES